ncbi:MULTISPECIES: DUF7167 family protein [Acinetobacter]|uniref:DUF7167 domain-containing protein n=1 Tax=Acinetobacter higginsii TaxID=70347 RepID=N9SM89_9GAMM|nr:MULTISPECIES: hypothetical protein [Acinetobacter]ENX55731.1 hypothetical protein F902_03290 [Acinetobacter higginsii]MCJ0829836.1 hypothetical protein [Acinetobacter sp. NIPH1876]
MSNFNELRIHFHMSIGVVNASQEDSFKLSDYIDEDEWNALSSDEKENMISEWANDWSINYLDLGGHVK